VSESPVYVGLCDIIMLHSVVTIRYDTRCYFNARSKTDMSQPNLMHGRLLFIVNLHTIFDKIYGL